MGVKLVYEQSRKGEFRWVERMVFCLSGQLEEGWWEIVGEDVKNEMLLKLNKEKLIVGLDFYVFYFEFKVLLFLFNIQIGVNWLDVWTFCLYRYEIFLNTGVDILNIFI